MKAVFLIIPLLFSSNLSADELEDTLSGFDEEPTANELGDLDESGFDDKEADYLKPSSKTEKALWYNISGYASLQGAYNFIQNSQSTVASGDKPMDFSGLSRTKFKGGLRLDINLGDNWRSKFEIMGWYDSSWAIKGKQNYTDKVLDTYEYFGDIKEAYVQGSLTKSLDLKFGRQIVIWGKSDSIRITDVINPLDNREAGMVDIEDLRLTKLMTRFDYYFGDWGLSTLFIHEPRLEIEPAFGSDYRPSNLFETPIPFARFPDREEPNWTLDNTQYAISLDGHFTGWDLSFYAARVFDNRFAIEQQNNHLIRTYDLINMGGIATNMASGNWLFKAEMAVINNINYRSTGRKNRLDILVGFDYTGIKDTVISLEIADRHIFNYEQKMLTMTLLEAASQNTFPDFVREDSLQIALRTSYSFDHDNASINYLISLAGGTGTGNNFDGGFQRLWIDYKYNDAVSLNIGAVDYIAGNSLISFYQAVENNDRVFAEIKYSF